MCCYATRNSGNEKFAVQKQTSSTSFHALAPLQALPANMRRTPSSLEEMCVFRAWRTSLSLCRATSSPTAHIFIKSALKETCNYPKHGEDTYFCNHSCTCSSLKRSQWHPERLRLGFGGKLVDACLVYDKRILARVTIHSICQDNPISTMRKGRGTYYHMSAYEAPE